MCYGKKKLSQGQTDLPTPALQDKKTRENLYGKSTSETDL